MIEYVIDTENWWKLTSKHDSGANSGSTEKVQDKLMFDIFTTKQQIKLYKVVENISLFVPNTMMNNLEYILTLLSSSSVLLTQTGKASTNYTIENLELEHETITNDQLTDQVTTTFSVGRSIPCKHITMCQNLNVNVP